MVKVSGWWELGRGLMRPGALLTKLVTPIWKRADAWQAVSHRIAGELAALGIERERIHEIPNAVDLSRFPLRRHAHREDAPRTAVFVGRLAPEKDLRNLVRAWAKVFHARRDRRLWLVGTGREMKALERMVLSLGCTDNVAFLGHRDDVAAVLAQADVGVLPSLMEGLSNTLLEYMASGLPVIASRVSGSEDLIRSGKTGWLHEPGEPAAMVAALRAMDAESDERLIEMGIEARTAVERHASRDRVIDRLLATYVAAPEATRACVEAH